MNCAFCKIAGKELKAKIISETELSLAFLDINPANPGHTLIIPKSHFTDISDTPDEVLSELLIYSKEVADILVKSLGATGFNILNASGKSAQQSVFHLHLHVVPRFDDDGKYLWFHGNNKDAIDLEKIFSATTNRSKKGFSI